MEEEEKSNIPNRSFVIMALVVGGLFTVGSLTLFVMMPSLIAQGGIPEAQTDFLRLSPVFFPRLAFAILSGLSLTYFISTARTLNQAEDGGIFEEQGTLPRILTLYSFAVVYPFLLPPLGYVISTIFLIGGMTLFLGTRIWWQVLSFSIFTPIMIRFVFERLLAISLPRSEFELIAVAEEGLMQILVSIFFGWKG
ncbi:MAG: tripartite tricarboxylate transporter TctB family protein [Nitrospinaceae bacterium]|jgi:hypothetical protein|nr:tripartite tricarboxylate transporter TctB family protein [Nitrospinaceae bacterium]MBT3434317.1 tripartite tricarboxylate transporter TctB family protein [Nitrospinaceae bacterium]MBT3820347.1 tripartite tricarboxylate transporter TctB family protein [Nitrospinaceae bacterium]MBT4094145.1 tripartite tricarboxylate transporter TctB family protein [Nitrospinaceae bacterium]MBT4432257.1 tripartite tricarboxylate transporter TctB family protein [Nitrospinaceae bacterium]